jgi:isoleucyl-tRNA synthetase
MPQVAEAVAALDAGHVARSVREGRGVGVFIDGHDHTLGPDDLLLALAPLQDYQLEREGSHAVALELSIDDDLRREGLAREVVHAVQLARRDAGLDISDRIDLALDGDAALLDAARAHEAYLTGEVLAATVAYSANGAGATRTTTSIEGRALQISVARTG